ncbi:3-dehydroquinate synthase [Clostridium botulinum]|uniref:3-dehydroquinate synthase n=1 Tax=Clostridium botulinum TaxID=1491 RepID=UPI000D11B575|nr:3-dehydroquinate synthase [Clostridium botulinum]AVQ45309.1 3-dehydroquinate synthase [Clostridium botulinum]AVQ49142.1 3-dehydroquinate synthase [Clostridium botulinum]
MKEIILESLELKHRVYINNNLNRFHNILLENKIKDTDSIFIVTDKNIYSLYKHKMEQFINKNKYFVFVMNTGEENKNINTVNKIYDFLIDNNANRHSVLIAFGGGIVGDITGFVASTYMRGIRFINIPTTLLAQVDSSIGGKVGYNHREIKNLIGNFYNPVFVYVSTSFLKTLSEREFLNGLGEIIKYSLIRENDLSYFIEKNIKFILEREQDKLIHIVKECLSIKAAIVEEDFRDLGMRNSLNFGHTVGHAIEANSNYKISHGEAVALGILVALKLSEKKLNLDKNIYNNIVKLYKKLNLPLFYKVDNYKTFLYAIRHDKKNRDKIRFALLEEVGKVKVKVEVEENEIIKAIKESIDREEK